jgi:hypothetical protein
MGGYEGEARTPAGARKILPDPRRREMASEGRSLPSPVAGGPASPQYGGLSGLVTYNSGLVYSFGGLSALSSTRRQRFAADLNTE